MPDSRSLVELLTTRAAQYPERTAAVFLEDDGTESSRVTYGGLDHAARAIATALGQHVSPGDPVLLVHPPGRSFHEAFLGCTFAGAVAVPVYPPDPARLEHSVRTFRAIVDNAQPKAILTESTLLPMAEALEHLAPEVRGIPRLASDQVEDNARDWRRPDLRAGALALLQYTSGTTRSPRGVMVTHENLLHNERLIEIGFGHEGPIVGVSWLPPYHDMGLIGTILQPIHMAGMIVMMSPQAFLWSPALWLKTISKYRACTSGGPGFAYALCTRRISDDDLAALDLSSWTVAFNAAEPIRADILDAFVDRFSACGFERRSFYPCYGLAEATLFVTGIGFEDEPRAVDVDAARLGGGECVRAGSSTRDVARVVDCGFPRGDTRIEIVCPDTRERLGDNRVGEIWVAGRSVADGYWRDPDSTAATFGATLADEPATLFLRTGDLGFRIGEALFVTGRIKDMLILHGRNHYPQDIEATVVAAHRNLRPSGCAAFSIDKEVGEGLIIAAEIERRVLGAAKSTSEEQPERTRHALPYDPPVAVPFSADDVIDAIRAEVLRCHDIAVDRVLLLKPGVLPKTSSGKLQRHRCKRLVEEGALESLWERDFSE